MGDFLFYQILKLSIGQQSGIDTSLAAVLSTCQEAHELGATVYLPDLPPLTVYMVEYFIVLCLLTGKQIEHKLTKEYVAFKRRLQFIILPKHTHSELELLRLLGIWGR